MIDTQEDRIETCPMLEVWRAGAVRFCLGKTSLSGQQCLALRDHYNMAVVTNDIHTKEDAEFRCVTTFFTDRIKGGKLAVAPIREMPPNLAAIESYRARMPGWSWCWKAGGDRSATFSPELSDL